MIAPTAVAHVVTLYQHGKANIERAATALEMLVKGYEHLNSAIYVASLVGDPALSRALDMYWCAADAFYSEFRRTDDFASDERLNALLFVLSAESKATRAALAQAFAALAPVGPSDGAKTHVQRSLGGVKSAISTA